MYTYMVVVMGLVPRTGQYTTVIATNTSMTLQEVRELMLDSGIPVRTAQTFDQGPLADSAFSVDKSKMVIWKRNDQ